MLTGLRCPVLVLVMVTLAACASQDPAPRILLLDYSNASTSPADASQPRDGCVYVTDGRSRDTLHGIRMPSEAVTVWLQNGVEAQLGLSARRSAEIPPDSAYIELKKAYITPITTVISGIVVIKVASGGHESVYRGRATRTNWWGSDGEQVRLLSDALDEALYQVELSARDATCPASGV